MIAKKKLPEVEEVHLKSIKGIRPGWWILGGIVLAIIIIFFMLCILPGIVSDSVYVRFDLPTDNTAIYMDGVYLGSSEGSVYRIPEGEHEFSFYILGRAAGSTSVDIPKSIFFTLFSHKTHTISFSIENSEEIEKAICTHFASEIASRSRVLDYSERVSFPPLFSSLAQNASSLCFDDISSLWLYGMLHITSETMYEDYLKGKDILSSSSVVYESDESIRLDETLSLMFSSEDMNETGKDNTAKSIKGSYDSGFFSYDSQSVTMGRSTALSYPEVNEASVDITVDSFSISSSMVTEYEYALFVEENPYWSRANLNALIEDGMVDENYLKGIPLSSSVISTRPIRNISYHAAEAYCAWLSEENGKEYALPSEAEWYVAALSAYDKPYSASLLTLDNNFSSPSSMMGGLWEMTSTPYLPLSRVSDYTYAIELGKLYPFDDIIVKGGSYINQPSDITIDTVGAFSRDMCSEYVGFRITEK